MAYPKFEYKYLFPLDLYETLRSRIEEMCPLDPYAVREADGRYTIRSVYFDSIRYRAYDQKVEGVRKRQKFRIRVYGNETPSSVAFLEIKQKDGALLTKYRAPVLYRNLPALFTENSYMHYIRSGTGAGVDRSNARRWMYYCVRKQLRPVVLINYERSAFAGVENFDLRITLDTSIRGEMYPGLTRMFDDSKARPAMKTHGILEVKFTIGVPMWMRNIIREYNLQRLALSKYTICIDALSHDARSSCFTGTALDRSERAARHLSCMFTQFQTPAATDVF
ncbi:polyphosphate polymerase domain-containing protein [bacterium]|nr:polyphosphate polymerase domain-containing protein [bacterium]